jgi:hypothetical protein
MLSLTNTAHRHEKAILAHLERLPGLADMVVDGPTEAFRERFDEECRFITGQLVPHVQAVEAALYPELERLMANVHSLVPMRHEHQELSRLMGSLCRYRADMEEGRLGLAEQTGLRRALYRLYSILKVHLAEEELFIGVLDHSLPEERKDALAHAMSHATSEPL